MSESSGTPDLPLLAMHSKKLFAAAEAARQRIRTRTNVTSTQKDQVLVNALQRAIAWMNTLSKLNEPGDFQAIAAANRGLLEVVVDMLLIHEDKQEWIPGRIAAWAASAEYDDLEALDDYYRRYPPLPPVHQMTRAWLQLASGAKLQNINPRRHPPRWIWLEHEIKRLQKTPACVPCQRGVRLEEMYAEGNQMLCWFVHGHSFPGLPGKPQSDLAKQCCGFVFNSWALITACVMVALHHFEKLVQWRGEPENLVAATQAAGKAFEAMMGGAEPAPGDGESR